ncbi:MAG: aminotransferase class IV [Prolixibacteraceae bacterium]|jgi:branched-chain amino acid aminotransferase|nr:aminotransferase class IV [Prolixibacteraceae bacterium]
MNSNYFIENGLIKTIAGKKPITGEIIVYEVIRIISGIPLFISEHYSRMADSCKSLGCQPPVTKQELLMQIVCLCKTNSTQNGNIKVEIGISKENSQLLLYFIPHAYPTPQMYNDGVEVGFLFAERKLPNIKTVQPAVRERANRLISESGFYEVLLVNHENKITEGSRSNIFFILDEQLLTPPLKQVLKGITLCKVLGIAKEKNISINYSNLAADELANACSMFLTGTSPKILPIAKAGENRFAVKHPMLQMLSAEYDVLIKQDIEKTKRLILK